MMTLIVIGLATTTVALAGWLYSRQEPKTAKEARRQNTAVYGFQWSIALLVAAALLSGSAPVLIGAGVAIAAPLILLFEKDGDQAFRYRIEENNRVGDRIVDVEVVS